MGFHKEKGTSVGKFSIAQKGNYEDLKDSSECENGKVREDVENA